MSSTLWKFRMGMNLCSRKLCLSNATRWHKPQSKRRVALEYVPRQSRTYRTTQDDLCRNPVRFAAPKHRRCDFRMPSQACLIIKFNISSTKYAEPMLHRYGRIRHQLASPFEEFRFCRFSLCSFQSKSICENSIHLSYHKYCMA
jgi:hypothetical protein